MIKSMTGYGKAECHLSQGKATVEIRSLNGKNCDISIKSQLIPREKELEVRQYIASRLYRGTIDLYITFEQSSSTAAKSINSDIYNNYLNQIRALSQATPAEMNSLESILLASAILRLPDVVETKREELSITPDQNRLEQEIVFYVEKLDINEEKVRLRQHCAYFMETIDSEQYPGKKIGFIAQEMGREINTTGSKANHAEIQRWVVRMKDELEKIKEQALNIL